MTILIWLILAVSTCIIAGNKNRSQIGWFISGALFGLFALILILILPKKE